MSAVAWMLGVALSWGSEVPLDEPVYPSRARLLDADRRAVGVYHAGLVLGTVGTGAEVVGLLTGDLELAFLGGLGEIVGAPIMAGSALGSRRILTDLGQTTLGGAGHTAWGLWFGGNVSTLVSWMAPTRREAIAYALVGVGARMGSYVAAGVQHRVNQKSRARLGLRKSPAHMLPARPVWVRLSPMTKSDTVGLVISLGEQ